MHCFEMDVYLLSIQVYTYLQTHLQLFFVKEKEGVSLRSFNLGEISKITVYIMRLKSDRING